MVDLEDKEMSNLEFAVVPLAAVRDLKDAIKYREENNILPLANLEKIAVYSLVGAIELGKALVYGFIVANMISRYYN